MIHKKNIFYSNKVTKRPMTSEEHKQLNQVLEKEEIRFCVYAKIPGTLEYNLNLHNPRYFTGFIPMPNKVEIEIHYPECKLEHHKSSYFTRSVVEDTTPPKRSHSDLWALLF